MQLCAATARWYGGVNHAGRGVTPAVNIGYIPIGLFDEDDPRSEFLLFSEKGEAVQVESS